MFKFTKSDFAKNIFKLMSGTIIAQLIPILLTPILSRLYSPEDFGIYSLFTSTCSILMIIATGRLQLAIMLPKEDKEAIRIMILSVMLAIGVSIILILILLLSGDFMLKLLSIRSLGLVVYVVPIYLIVNSVVYLCQYYYNRKQRFSNIRNIMIMGAVVSGGVNVGIGIIHPIHAGLIFGGLTAPMFCIYWWIKHDISLIKETLFSTTIKDYERLAMRYIKHLTLAVPGGLMNAISASLPIYLLNYYYASGIVGQYMMSQRLIALPISFIMTAFIEAFRQNASNIYNSSGNMRPFLLRYTKYLFFISILPFTILVLAAPYVFTFVLGKAWNEAGIISGILAIRFFFCFVFSGISSIIIQITERYKFDILWQACLIALSFLIFYIGHLFWSFYLTLTVYVLLYAFMYLVSYLFSYHISNKSYEVEKH